MEKLTKKISELEKMYLEVSPVAKKWYNETSEFERRQMGEGVDLESEIGNAWGEFCKADDQLQFIQDELCKFTQLLKEKKEKFGELPTWGYLPTC